MATKYDVISKNELLQILSSMSVLQHIDLPYDIGEIFSPSQVRVIQSIIYNIDRSITNRITAAINSCTVAETTKIDRCFLCDKNDNGGPKLPT